MSVHVLDYSATKPDLLSTFLNDILREQLSSQDPSISSEYADEAYSEISNSSLTRAEETKHKHFTAGNMGTHPFTHEFVVLQNQAQHLFEMVCEKIKDDYPYFYEAFMLSADPENPEGETRMRWLTAHEAEHGCVKKPRTVRTPKPSGRRKRASRAITSNEPRIEILPLRIRELLSTLHFLRAKGTPRGNLCLSLRYTTSEDGLRPAYVAALHLPGTDLKEAYKNLSDKSGRGQGATRSCRSVFHLFKNFVDEMTNTRCFHMLGVYEQGLEVFTQLQGLTFLDAETLVNIFLVEPTVAVGQPAFNRAAHKHRLMRFGEKYLPKMEHPERDVSGPISLEEPAVVPVAATMVPANLRHVPTGLNTEPSLASSSKRSVPEPEEGEGQAKRLKLSIATYFGEESAQLLDGAHDVHIPLPHLSL